MSFIVHMPSSQKHEEVYLEYPASAHLFFRSTLTLFSIAEDHSTLQMEASNVKTLNMKHLLTLCIF